ncbi:unnamed protein product [Blepharisma stoltei]|uniref:Uncharacterized protein n=1 Tax=Blepharisma stoltei TaxID=1481888 RepID=A0AAU9J095_9CILI|nr:unnamed protein product [Blepharisma stoltei]
MSELTFCFLSRCLQSRNTINLLAIAQRWQLLQTWIALLVLKMRDNDTKFQRTSLYFSKKKILYLSPKPKGRL